VNTALDGLRYVPPSGFTGTVTLTITTEDLGNTGAGGPRSDVDSLSISVQAGPALTADIVDVQPDPRAGSIGRITVRFSEAVTGFDLSDLQLTWTTDATVSLLPGTATLTTSDNVSWVIGDLGPLTRPSGMYQLTLNAAGSGIQAAGGGGLAGSVQENWINGAGDANLDNQFDPADLVTVLQANRYLTDLPATWSSGDWNGDGLFNPRDIVTAQQTSPAHYLKGPYLAHAGWAAASPSASLDARIVDHVFGQSQLP
jgi:hypothetical protein